MPSEHSTSYVSGAGLNLGSLSSTRLRGRIFEPLDPTKKQIRLLRVLPTGTSGARPRDPACSLHIETLDSELQFDAISYCWGKGKKRKKIRIDGKWFRITRTVYGILKTFRSANGPSGYYWIDSICINQKDKVEKSLQIPMMDDIYSKAEIVHVCLGPLISNIERFLTAAEEVTTEVSSLEGELQSNDETQTSPRGAVPAVSDEDLEIQRLAQRATSALIEADGNIMQPLKDILASPWWSRFWVVQETLLAREVVLHCGGIMIPWHTVLTMCGYLSYDKFYQNLSTTPAEAISDDSWGTIVSVTGLFSKSQRSSPDGQRSMSEKDIIRLLHNINMQSVTDPRDRIYGMFALLPVGLRVQPDYNMSPSEVFTDFTLRLMHCLKSLNVLNLVGQTPTWPRTCVEWRSSLPSWVPYLPDMNYSIAYTGWNGSRSATCFIKNRSGGHLAVHGHLVGTITSLGDMMPYPPVVESTREVLANWHGLFARRNRSEESQDICSVPFWREIALRLSDKRAKTAVLANIRNVSAQLDAWVIDDASVLDEAAESLKALLIFYTHEMMFQLDGGQIGLGCFGTQEDDVIAILAGCNSPVVLRSQQESPAKYKIVGICACACSSSQTTCWPPHILTYLGISHGEYIYQKAKLQVNCDGSNTRSADVRSFLEGAVQLYLIHEDYLWTVSFDRMKTAVTSCIRSMFDEDSRGPIESLVTKMWDVVFEPYTFTLELDDNAPASIIERVVSLMPNKAADMALLIQHCFAHIIILYETLQRRLSESSSFDKRLEVEDLKEAGLRFGLLIFEVHKRAHEIQLREERDLTEHVVLLMENAVLTDLDERLQAGDIRAKWCQGLRLAAKEFLQVQAHVDEVFEEIILV